MNAVDRTYLKCDLLSSVTSAMALGIPQFVEMVDP